MNNFHQFGGGCSGALGEFQSTSAAFDNFDPSLAAPLTRVNDSTGISRSKFRHLRSLVGSCVDSHCHLLISGKKPSYQNYRDDLMFAATITAIRHEISQVRLRYFESVIQFISQFPGAVSWRNSLKFVRLRESLIMSQS